MPETPFSFSHIESPAPGAAVPAGWIAIRGWVWPKARGHFVDVRAVAGDRMFPGIHGFPRADLAAHFGCKQPVALAEFTVAIELPVGPTPIRLEVLTIEGTWQAFDELCLNGSAGPAAVSPLPGPPPLRWHEYGRGLQRLLRTQRAEADKPLAAVAAQVVATLPRPQHLRHPHLPFHGHLDEPAALTRCGFGRTAALGWLFHDQQPIKRVLGTFDLQVWQTIQHGLPSPGPGAHFPDSPTAAHAGLFGILDVPAQLPQPVTLRLYAELADGTLHLGNVQRCGLYTNEEEKAPYPSRDQADFDSTRAAFDAALAAAGCEVTRDPDLETEINRVRHDFALRAPGTLPRVAPLAAAPATTAPLPRRVLLATHNLNREGAPLFLLDYARHLAEQGVELTVVSPSAGPLQERFEALGARVLLINADPILGAQDEASARTAITQALAKIDFGACDLVVGNTFTTFWAVHAAKAAGRPVLLYVHESTTPASFYLGRVHPRVVALVDAAFGLADRVSFTTASTRGYHLDYGRPENHCLTPGWIDVKRIDAWREAHPRAELRSAFSLGADELLVTNVGTVCDRKGQHIFVRAVDLLTRRYPELAARTRFVMLGGGDTPFDDVLRDLLEQVQLPRIEVHPATSDYFPYYAAADLFVCSTYEESSPRVILETMACQTPILASGVQGVPEQVTDGVEAMLVPPGDTAALAEAMARILTSPATGAELAARARARVLREFDAGILLPRHLALAAAVARPESTTPQL